MADSDDEESTLLPNRAWKGNMKKIIEFTFEDVHFLSNNTIKTSSNAVNTSWDPLNWPERVGKTGQTYNRAIYMRIVANRWMRYRSSVILGDGTKR